MLPKFADQGFQAIAVMSNAYVNQKIADLYDDISYPLVMDLDREGQRVYGYTAPTYPRNIVIDRDGTVAHEDIAQTLDEAEAAIEALLADERHAPGQLGSSSGAPARDPGR